MSNSANTTSILLASPREPSGSSWLINCLLELGVRVNFKTVVDRVWRSVKNPREPSAMWEPAPDGRWSLHPRADALRKWLPILGDHDTLPFRDDIETLYVQDLPRPEFTGTHSALFIRDPRDAIHSYYRRIQPDMPLDEFVRFPHPETLLDVIDHWRLFAESWMAYEGIHVYRFEDYKADAIGLLSRILQDFGIEPSPEDIARAAAASSYERARDAEERYRASHPRDEEVAMRAGRVGEWKSSADLRELSREIEKRTRPVLIRLGYELHSSDESMPQLPDLLKLASTIDADAIRRARFHAREARMLLDNLRVHANLWPEDVRRRIDAARAEFDDGADYHMTRIRELMASRRAGRSPQPNSVAEERPPTQQTEEG